MDKFAVPGSQLVWHDNESSFHWGVKVTQFYIDDVPVYGSREKPHEAILDSGGSYLNLPSDVYNTIKNQILRKTDCFYDRFANLVCECKGYDPDSWGEIFPRLRTKIDDITYIIPIKSYIMPTGNSECIVEMHSMDADYWEIYIFGLTFMENYYSVYDMESNRVGMALSNNNKL